MIPKLKKYLGALKFTCKAASYGAKVKLAHGCIMSTITYGLQVWGLHCTQSVLKKVQSIQTNTLKWITSNYTGSLKELLETTKWMSIYQLTVYHSVLLWWKVNFYKNLIWLLRRIENSQETEARLLLTERIWSRKAEFFYRKVEPLLREVVKISIA